MAAPFEPENFPEKFKDTFREKLKEILAAKRQGQEISVSQAPQKPAATVLTSCKLCRRAWQRAARPVASAPSLSPKGRKKAQR
jgi:non-homologous end joining protein Ku